MATWKLPPRRFPHGSYSEIPLELPPLKTNMPDRYSPDAVKGVLDDVERRDAKIANALLSFHKALSAGLDWLTEQLGVAFVGVPLVNQRGQLTIADNNANGVATFATEEIDTNYSVFVTPVGFTGSPAAVAIKSVTKATTGITVGLTAAPGAGTNVILDWMIAREIVR